MSSLTTHPSAIVAAGDYDGARARERQRLLNGLLEAVKECQARFGGRAELATEAEGRVVELCSCLEEALSHGLRVKPLSASKGNSALRQMTDLVSNSLNFNRGSPQDTLVFWHYIREHLTRHELERYLLLKQIWSDVGRGRAWLRAALNERSLERYLHCLLANPQHAAVFYEDWAFLQDPERSATLPNMAAGLGSILFAIGIDNPQLNQELSGPALEGEVSTPLCSEPVICAAKGLDQSSKRRNEQKRRRRVQPQIISFGDDDGLTAGSPPLGVQPVVDASPSGEASDAGSMDEAVPRNADCPKPRPGHLPLSTSPLAHRLETTLRVDARATNSSNTNKERAQTLTPVTNVSVGELIPVTLISEDAYSEEDSLSVPSYSEDTECAAAALLATQRLLQSNCVDFSPQECNLVTHRTPTDHSTSLNGESREALLTVLALKEELQAEVRQLRQLLEQTEERCAHLQAEAQAAERASAERTQRLETRTQALTRENELLKHQLRKYVGAVQLLKRDGLQAHEALASLQATQPRAEPAPDYMQEARQYEKKLIQVAEMHGELMEFNERLHRLLQLKDAQLRRLREELIDLRGPLPDDVQTSDDDVSVTSDYDASSLGAAARVLVNIWIPSAFLTGGSSDVHHVYQVFIRIRDDEWNIYRRYAQFYSLHKELKKQDAVVNTFDFPPKKTIGNKDARFVEERRRRLQHYLRCVVNHLVQTNAELAANPDKELLIGLVPFFGEMNVQEERSRRRRRASSRNPFSRSRPDNSGQPSEPSPHYQGL